MATDTRDKIYACAIIGGGLGGLCLAIQLAKQGLEVVLFEKNSYPQHKVCGEYISMESWDFLKSLGLALDDLNLPKITQLGISAENGFMLNSTLALGGFGISRYNLDHYLAQLARAQGIVLYENCKVLDVGEEESVQVVSTSQGIFGARIVCGSFGKYTPSFAKEAGAALSKAPNYIGVKYHIRTDLASDRIELHNFRAGYCGISKVDQERYCLCYLSNSSNLKQADNDLKRMEETVLYRNPFLKRYFSQAEFLYDKPMVISNIYFEPKATYLGGMLMLGDSAGAISPLCGNGMSMAMRASKLLAELLGLYFRGGLSKEELIERYGSLWKANFGRRIWVGQKLQHLFGKNRSTNLALKTLHYLPPLTQKLISLTHGRPF